MVDANCTERYTKFGGLREVFRTTPMVEMGPLRSNHPHPLAAATRRQAVDFAVYFASRAGRKLYDVQNSALTRSLGISGIRVPFVDKDFKSLPCHDVLTDDAIALMVDVDYYPDMHEFLSGQNGFGIRPWLLISMVPNHAAGPVFGDGSYRWRDNNTVEVVADGADPYVHGLWDYGHDTIRVRDTVTGRITVFEVDSLDMGYCRHAILLIPVATFGGPSWWKTLVTLTTCGLVGWRWGVWWAMAHLLWSELSMRVFRTRTTGNMLRRMKPIRDGFAVLDVVSSGVVSTSVSRVDAWSSATLPSNVVSQLREQVLAVKSQPSIANVQAAIKIALGTQVREDSITLQAALFASYLSEIRRRPQLVFRASAPCADKVSYGPLSTELAPKTPGVVLMRPLATGAHVPQMTAENQQAMHIGRIKKMANSTKTTPYMVTLVNEYVNCLVPAHLRHTVYPVDECEVVEDWVKPSQTRGIRKHHGWTKVMGGLIRGILKHEAYGAASDPRPIFPFEGPEKLKYARMVRAATNYVKHHCKWYAFSKHPEEIARRVAAIMSGKDSACETDYSRYDGSTPEIAHELALAIMLALFPCEYAQDIVELFNILRNRKVSLDKYVDLIETLFMRVTGEPGTSLWNTIFNSFVCFAALRNTVGDFDFYTAEQAWTIMQGACVFGGDDGVANGAVEPARLEWAAKYFGLKLKASVKQRGELVGFLGRKYMPWDGDYVSCCDFVRILPKFHLAMSAPADKLALLNAKTLSALADDSETPLFGDILFAIHTRLGGRTPIAGVGSYHFRLGTEGYPNETRGWMRDLMAEVGITDVRLVETWYKDYTTPLDDWLASFPTIELTKRDDRLGMVVGDVYNGPEADTPDAATAEVAEDAAEITTSVSTASTFIGPLFGDGSRSRRMVRAKTFDKNVKRQRTR